MWGIGIFLFLAGIFSTFGEMDNTEMIARQFYDAVRKGSLEKASSLCADELKPHLSRRILQRLQNVFETLPETPEIRTLPRKKSVTVRVEVIRFRLHGRGPQQLVLTITSDDRICSCTMLPDIPFPELDKEKMLADFDRMTALLRNTFPFTLANRELFGLDVWGKLAEYRSRITGEESFLEFAALLQEALAACKGNHLSLSSAPYHFLKAVPEILKIFSVSEEELKITQNALVLNTLRNPAYRCRSIRLKYYAGAYYSEYSHQQGNTFLPYGSELTAVDGRKPEELLPALQDRLDRFDFKCGVFYGSAFTGLGDNFYVFMDLPPREFRFRTREGREIILHTDAPIQIRMPQHPAAGIPQGARYLPQEKILYLRIPSMSLNSKNFYKKEILKQRPAGKIDAVVLDVRFNGGGSDHVWQEILSMLLSEPVKVDNTWAVFDSPENREYFKRRKQILPKAFPEHRESRGVSRPWERRELPWLGKDRYLVRENTLEIIPTEDSLKLSCPIYILAQDIYSSTGGLLAVARQCDQLVSIGMPSPVSLGKGPDPIHLALPNSGLVFSLAVAADISGCQRAADTFHGDVEVPLELSAEEFFDYWNSDTGADPVDYLRKKDPFMRKVLAEILLHRTNR